MALQSTALPRSEPGRLNSVYLEQNEACRDEVYSSIIAASLCVLLLVIIGIVGPSLFRPQGVLLFLLWPVVGMFFAYRARIFYLRACEAGLRLAALENYLWQQALTNLSTSKPKRLLLTRPSAKARSNSTVVTIVWIVCVGLAILSFSTLFNEGRIYLHASAKSRLPVNFTFTEHNVGNVVTWDLVRLSLPPDVRTSADLIGTTLAAECQANSSIDTLQVYEPPIDNREEMSRPIMASAADDQAVAGTAPLKAPPNLELTNCLPYIGYASDGAPSIIDANMPPLILHPSSVRFVDGALPIDLPDIHARPGQIRYADGNEPVELPDLAVKAPSLRFDPEADQAQLPDLTVLPPSIDYPPKTYPVQLPVLAADPPDLVYPEGSAPIALPELRALPPSIHFEGDGASGAEQVPLPDLSKLSTQPDVSMTLWFTVNCPQLTESTRLLAKEGHYASCNAGSSDGYFNQALNEHFHTSPQQVVTAATEILQRWPKARFVVVGHADQPGSQKFNDALAEDRAKYVSTLLQTAFGLDPKEASGRIRNVALGGDFPWIPQASSEESQALNRRVSIYIYK